MISGLLDTLANGYGRQALRTNPQGTDRTGVPGLLQNRGLPMWQNRAGQRSPNYTGLLGLMGQQPYMWGYEGLGNRGPVDTPFSLGYTAVPGTKPPGPQSDYLDRVFAAAPAAPAATGNFGGYDQSGNPNFGSYINIYGPGTGWVPYEQYSQAYQDAIDAEQALQGG